ncbi:hypothetical protein B0H15DRAFT_973514 [Mycena belliarum]|uniref:Uncharacterized protein n=1 Tax=Mycena belliarum TaxID=1033014 RepID=A0AAD6U9N1_9AGAR|nr:hypothetical protein B0H15DRAFT_973514 [Mycena belliae]
MPTRCPLPSAAAAAPVRNAANASVNTQRPRLRPRSQARTTSAALPPCSSCARDKQQTPALPHACNSAPSPSTLPPTSPAASPSMRLNRRPGPRPPTTPAPQLRTQRHASSRSFAVPPPPLSLAAAHPRRCISSGARVPKDAPSRPPPRRRRPRSQRRAASATPPFPSLAIPQPRAQTHDLRSPRFPSIAAPPSVAIASNAAPVCSHPRRRASSAAALAAAHPRPPPHRSSADEYLRYTHATPRPTPVPSRKHLARATPARSADRARRVRRSLSASPSPRFVESRLGAFAAAVPVSHDVHPSTGACPMPADSGFRCRHGRLVQIPPRAQVATRKSASSAGAISPTTTCPPRPLARLPIGAEPRRSPSSLQQVRPERDSECDAFGAARPLTRPREDRRAGAPMPAVHGGTPRRPRRCRNGAPPPPRCSCAPQYLLYIHARNATELRAPPHQRPPPVAIPRRATRAAAHARVAAWQDSARHDSGLGALAAALHDVARTSACPPCRSTPTPRTLCRADVLPRFRHGPASTSAPQDERRARLERSAQAPTRPDPNGAP